MALLDELTTSERPEALRRLQVPKNVSKEMLAGIKDSKTALSKLKDASQKDIYYTLSPLNLHTILFSMAKAKQKDRKQAISIYLTKLRNIEPELTGKDLRSMGYPPGPLFKEILTAILDARLERQIKSREGEIKFVKDKFPLK
jgi:tRNA nucleotidyltransferase (CCA-adding enzyme)